MKTIIAIILLTLMACNKEDSASGSCEDSLAVGSWIEASIGDDIIKFNGDCTGTGSYCESTFTYPNVVTADGVVVIDVDSYNGADGCLPLGKTACAFLFQGDSLYISCEEDYIVEYIKN